MVARDVEVLRLGFFDWGLIGADGLPRRVEIPRVALGCRGSNMHVEAPGPGVVGRTAMNWQAPQNRGGRLFRNTGRIDRREASDVLVELTSESSGLSVLSVLVMHACMHTYMLDGWMGLVGGCVCSLKFEVQASWLELHSGSRSIAVDDDRRRTRQRHRGMRGTAGYLGEVLQEPTLSSM